MTYPYAPVSAFADVALGKMLQSSARKTSDVYLPYLHASNIQKNGLLDLKRSRKSMWFSESESDSLTLRTGDIVVVEGGSVGQSAILSEDLDGWGFQNSVLRIRTFPEKGFGRYINYALQNGVNTGDVRATVNAVSIPHLTAERLGRYRVPLPPLTTQRAIAAFLDRETAEIDAMAAELDELAARLQGRKDEMVDHLLFGHSTSDFAIHETTAGRGIEWLPTIPKSWSIRPAWCVFGERKSRADVSETHLTPSQKFGVLPQIEYIERSGARVVLNLKGGDSMKLVLPGDFVIHLRSFQGGIERSYYRGKVSVAYTILSPSEAVSGEYFNHLLKSPRFVHALAAMTDQLRDGQVISFARFSQLSLPCPPGVVQHQIGSKINELSERFDSMISDAQELKSLLAERRSALITEVVTGRKEVPVS